jgi:acyl carrier protein
MKDKLLALINEVIAQLNETRDEKIPTENLSRMSLYGDEGVFDSMHLVNFLALVEEALEDEFDVEVSLTSEKAVSMRVSPFSRVDRLIAFTIEEVDLARDGEPVGEADDVLARQSG